MDKPIIIDKRQVRLEEILKRDFIPFLGGRPTRTTVIQHDDITDLRILLHTTDSVEAFLEQI